MKEKNNNDNNTLKVVIIVALIFVLVIISTILIIGVIAGKSIIKLTSKSKLNTYKSCEKYYKIEAANYFDSHRVLYPIDRDVIILTDEIGDCKPCGGYVIINAKENKYDAYLKCDNYKTDGYDEKVYNDVITK